MKANELRIGNYYLNDGDVCKVTIHTFNDMEWEGSYVGQPIPLTEEWLVKLNFDLVIDYYLVTININKKYLIEINLKTGATRFRLYDTSFYGMDCLYVHQLQNLYFALTGKELKLQEND